LKICIPGWQKIQLFAIKKNHPFNIVIFCKYIIVKTDWSGK
jgi:hypothetical protein